MPCKLAFRLPRKLLQNHGSSICDPPPKSSKILRCNSRSGCTKSQSSWGEEVKNNRALESNEKGGIFTQNEYKNQTDIPAFLKIDLKKHEEKSENRDSNKILIEEIESDEEPL